MAEPDSKRLPISEFRDRGYLHEVNRLVLHPLGLALEVSVVAEPGVRLSLRQPDFEEAKGALTNALEYLPDGATKTCEGLQKLLGTLDQRAERYETGDAFLGGVWNCQDDPEGVTYGEDLLSPEKAERVCQELLARRDERKRRTGGFVVQPLPDHQVLSTTYTAPSLRSTGREVVEPGRFAGVELSGDDE